jgi:hypothetical protein
MRQHTSDEQCTVDPQTDLCSECGVDHSATCRECSGRGFHKPGCSLSDAPARFTDEPFEEHRGIVFPAWLQAWGFEDTSYRNDSCARATKPLADGVNDLVCWVNYPDAAEYDEKMYRVELVVHEQTEPVADLYEGDDVELVKAAIRGCLQTATTNARV